MHGTHKQLDKYQQISDTEKNYKQDDSQATSAFIRNVVFNDLYINKDYHILKKGESH